MSEINQKERASRAWEILTRVASEESTITYKQLGKSLGVHHRAIRFVLREIQNHGLAEKLPPITILVVGQEGSPGAGFMAWDIDDLERGLSMVYGYPWSDLENPFGFAVDGDTIESIADEIVNHHVTSKDAYSRIKSRGMAQLVFRESLLKIYDNQCAVSDFNSSQLLEAAHIIPWSQADTSQRIDPCNGILLSVMHHKFFDLGWINFNEDYTIAVDVSQTSARGAERKILQELEGRKLRLPRDPMHHPNLEFIRVRNK